MNNNLVVFCIRHSWSPDSPASFPSARPGRSRLLRLLSCLERAGRQVLDYNDRNSRSGLVVGVDSRHCAAWNALNITSDEKSGALRCPVRAPHFGANRHRSWSFGIRSPGRAAAGQSPGSCTWYRIAGTRRRISGGTSQAWFTLDHYILVLAQRLNDGIK